MLFWLILFFVIDFKDTFFVRQCFLWYTIWRKVNHYFSITQIFSKYFIILTFKSLKPSSFSNPLRYLVLCIEHLDSIVLSII